jgi:hypothetical protein
MSLWEMIEVQCISFHFRRRSESPRHFPTCYSDQHDALPEEEYADFVHRFHDPSIVFDAAPATAMKK